MERRLHIVLLLMGIIGATSAQDFYVAAPRVLRLNSYEKIAVAVDGERGALANITIYDHPGKVKKIFEAVLPVQPGNPETFQVKLDATEFPPEYFSAPESPKLVSLIVRILHFERETLIPITNQSGYMFIQTDKPIYTPRERASFRLIPLTEEGLPASERIKLEIKDPAGTTFEKTFPSLSRRSTNPFRTFSYKFPPNPVLGEWTAVVFHGTDLGQVSSATFELQEYVLPTFVVQLTTPAVILPSDDTIAIHVEARYVFGKSVNGIASLRLGVKDESSPDTTYFAVTNSKDLVDGSLTVRISTDSFKSHKDVGWFPRIEGSIFVVEATVVDTATGNKEVKTNSKSRFSKSPFIISFEQYLSDFKPGFTSVFEADITYADGKPAEGIGTKLNAVADNGRTVHITQSNSTSDEQGKVAFEIHPEIHHNTITLTLETTDLMYYGNQAKGTYTLRAFKSKNNAFIAISRGKPSKLRPGDIFGRDIQTEPPGFRDIYYLVVAKGHIKLFNKLPTGSYRLRRIEFEVTHDMVPSFRLIVFAHYGNELIADSLKFDMEKICSPEAAVTLETVFHSKEPGDNGNIIMRGTKDTSVGLLAVDAAVYALSKTPLLTQKNVFNHLASHDLGCGPGGGVDVNDVLRNAGIIIATNRFSSSHSDSCAEVKRKKRSIGSNSDSFEEDNGFLFMDYELLDEVERQTAVRKDFRETWVSFETIIGPDRKEEVQLTLPHSITTWVIQAVSLSPTEGLCVAEPKTLVSFKKIFLHLNLPYYAKQNEQIQIQATVFNYGDQKTAVLVFMYGVEGICSETEPEIQSERKKLYIDGNSAETVTFSVIPLKEKEFSIKVAAISVQGSDIIEKRLHVVPQGMREEIKIAVRLDPTNLQRRQRMHIEEEHFTDSIDLSQNVQMISFDMSLPDAAVPGTATFTITVTGDLAEPVAETSLENPDDMISMPSGNGEANMMRLAPAVYTMQYLKYTGELSSATEDRGYEIIRSGIYNQLNYKKADGSYSIWQRTTTSTWLTAFVMKVFCHCENLIHIDKDVISSGTGWFVKNQEYDGSFIEKNRILRREMMGGVDGKISITAFVLISLQECSNKEPAAYDDLMLARLRAAAFLEGHINEVQTPLQAAIVAYALALTNSTDKVAANQKLLSMANYDPGNSYLYWTASDSSHDIETAGYGLLTQLLFNDFHRSTSVVNWLKTKKLQAGDFKSTQDTVIALQSLSEYARVKTQMTDVNLLSNITLSRDKGFSKNLTVNENTALNPLSITHANPGGLLFVRTQGTGLATLTLKMRYNVVKQDLSSCKFEIKATVSEVEKAGNPEIDVGKTEEKRNNALHINVCIKYLGSENAGTSIADVEIFSGFVPDAKDLEELERDPKSLIQKFEKSKRGVVFYLQEVPYTEDYCLSFKVYRKYDVGGVLRSVIRVYDNPDDVCSVFYSLNGASLLKTLCGGGVCQCAEVGCPPRAPFQDLMQQSVATRREKLHTVFCEDYDYVWKGQLRGRIRKHAGLLNVTFKVETVIKAGIEKKEDVEGEIRLLLAQDGCETAIPFPGTTYLISGKDPLTRGNDYENYQYLLGRNSIIHPWTSVAQAQNKVLQRDLNYVTRELERNGCAV